tara:strand:- start:2728 stop:3039 length:312 start_codon:yes stop_codon:yes gene_type:complete
MDLSKAINSFRFYDKNGNYYDISKLELKTNRFSNEQLYNGKWILKKNISLGTAQFLSVSGEFVSKFKYMEANDDEKALYFCFNTPEDALETFLSQHSDVEIYS